MTNSITTEMLIKEIMWENHQIDEGVRKYRETMAKKDGADTTGGQRLLKSAMANTVAGIEEAYKVPESLIIPTFKVLTLKEKLALTSIEQRAYNADHKAYKALSKTDGGGQDNWVYMIGLISAEQAAVIALNKVITHCHTESKRTTGGITQLTKAIGSALNQQLKFENWKAEEKILSNELGYKKSKAQLLIEQAKGQINRQKLIRWEKKFDRYRNLPWGDDTINIGAKLLDIVCETNPEVFTLISRLIQGKTQRIVSMTDTAWAEYEQSEDLAELQNPFLLPTLIPPAPFTYIDGKVQGGYHHIDSPLFSRGINAHTAGDNHASSESFLESVNLVQNTAWKINPYILMVVDMIYGTGAKVGGVTQLNTQVTPSMPADSYNNLSKEDRAEYHAKRNLIVEEIASAKGRHSAFTRKLAIAHKMASHSEFYYPHFSDFRGRLYPMAAELTPQGDQVAKALLMFAKGERLGTSGLRWLRIHTANTFGMDKETLDNREQWTLDNIQMIQGVAASPLTNDTWTSAEEPLTFLAAAKELTLALALDNPEDFVSHIPCAQDGTCNGMQILSMLGRDQLGAEATNCTGQDARFDLYTTVADAVKVILQRDARECSASAEWLARVLGADVSGRKIVKRAVMTIPYGVTDKGIAKQLINDRHCDGFITCTRDTAADVMTRAILESMLTINGKAVDIMGYFQKVSHILARDGKPLTWYTPNGLKVTQAYNRTALTVITTVIGEVSMPMENSNKGLDSNKQLLSSSPNIIHSFDAAMLQMTVLKLAKEGHTDFAMIHDSYGMHASKVEELHVALRQVALDVFGGTALQDFHEYVQGTTAVQLPLPPAQGTYDINEIINAPYFFS